MNNKFKVTKVLKGVLVVVLLIAMAPIIYVVFISEPVRTQIYGNPSELIDKAKVSDNIAVLINNYQDKDNFSCEKISATMTNCITKLTKDSNQFVVSFMYKQEINFNEMTYIYGRVVEKTNIHLLIDVQGTTKNYGS